MKLIFTSIYFRKIQKLLTDIERIEAENDVAENPLAWPLIKGSGGIRIIYYYYTTINTIYMLTAYGKNEQENLSEADKKVLRKLVKALKEESYE